MSLGGIGPAGIWLIAALALGIAELAIPGVFLVFIAIAAAITAAAIFALPVLPLAAQLGSFAAWSVSAVLIGRRWYTDYPVASADDLLNDPAHRLIGAIVTVELPIDDGHGRVRVGDGSWPAVGDNADIGEQLRVVSVNGGVLRVEALESGETLITHPVTI